VGPAESQTPWNVVAGDYAWSGPAHTGQPDNEGLQTVCSTVTKDNTRAISNLAHDRVWALLAHGSQIAH